MWNNLSSLTTIIAAFDPTREFYAGYRFIGAVSV
jgi:hypothetical protein